MKPTIERFEDLFKLTGKLKVPDYQRAYAWETEQLNQFVSDMLEMKNKGNYYYGHFILEETNNDYEIIDGQQRLTTFILFLIVCSQFKPNAYQEFIQKFETVNYDLNVFNVIREKGIGGDTNWEAEYYSSKDGQTLSGKRMIDALHYFRNLFLDDKSELRLNPNEIDDYLKTFIQANISAHIAYDKAIAVQIFELQNTRGLKLNLLEKVKSKLMKAVYLHHEQADEEEPGLEKVSGVQDGTATKEQTISNIQNHFARIYQLEESIRSNAFRGTMTIGDIFLHHLRIIDDGSKLKPSEKNTFTSPSQQGDKEKSILNYLDQQVSKRNSKNVVSYILSLVENFKKTVEFVSLELLEQDYKNPLIGDSMILDSNRSLEFLILLHHKGFNKNIASVDLIKSWEKLLFTRDFHDKYYRQWYRDDFERLFYEISLNNNEELTFEILKKFLNEGFRSDLMVNGGLPETVSTYIQDNKNNILNNAFFWRQDKMVYLLYKFEIKNNSHLENLRKIMKDGRSLEHILPQEWSFDWINTNHPFTPEESQERSKEINGFINGIGNLLLISGSENSSKSNNHPGEKYYESCSGGSYENHNANAARWKEPVEWGKIISERGENLFNFLNEFIK